ncbi:MAG: flavin monoamine oxidase family protein [Bacteroidota bacterium]
MLHNRPLIPRQADVIIVGAGLAGLSAAQKIVEKGRSVIVLEARERVGGRTFTVEGPAGEKIDLGGQWIGSDQHHIRDLINDLGLLTFKQYNDGRKILDILRKQKTYEGLIPKIGIKGLIELSRIIKKMDVLAKTIPLDRPWEASKAKAYDQESLETWINKNLGSKRAQALIRIFVKMVFCVSPSEISLLFFLYYLHSGNGFDALADTKEGAQAIRVMGGTQQISEMLGQQLGNQLVLNCPVEAIINDEAGIDVKTNQGLFHGKYLIMAIPPALVDRVRFSPKLPLKRIALGQRMPMGSVIKTIAIYDSPFWRTQGFSGEVVSDGHPLVAVFDDLPADSQIGALLGFAAADRAIRFSALNEEERKRLVLNQLAKYFGKKALEPIAYIEQNWLEEEWSSGCYVGVPTPNTYVQYGKALRKPFIRCHWAGTETAEKWNGYMDGAVSSGKRAAQEVIDRLTDDDR